MTVKQNTFLVINIYEVEIEAAIDRGFTNINNNNSNNKSLFTVGCKLKIACVINSFMTEVPVI